jgi:hypothetical protein
MKVPLKEQIVSYISPFFMNRTALFPPPTLPHIPPQIHPTHQNRGGVRTAFMINEAPCGVFSDIESTTSNLQVRLCQSINFTTGLATYQSIDMHVNGVWDSYDGQPCDCAQLLSVNKRLYSDHVHSAYDKGGHLAWAWQSGGGALINVGVAWTELTEAELLASPTSVNREIVYPSNAADMFFSPALTYDCWGTLTMHMSYAQRTSNEIRLYTTYKLSTDPPLSMRLPAPTAMLAGPQVATVDNYGFPYTLPSTYTGVPRPNHVLAPIETGSFGSRIYLARQDHTIVYQAVDGCGNTANCTQTIFLQTNGTCLS